MGKVKLKHFAEMKHFSNIIEPSILEVLNNQHILCGKWNKEIFKNKNPITIELGCGKGEYTISLAKKFSNRNFIGMDMKGARLWRGCKTALNEGLTNTFFIRSHIDFLKSFFVENEISEIWVTFPDPHKEKPKKRLTSSKFLNLYKEILTPNGIINLKTDNFDLYEYSYNIAKINDLKILDATTDLYQTHLGNEILSIRTFYENQFLEQNKKICYLAFELSKNKIFVEP